MKEKILITGAGGMIGKRLIQILEQEGYAVNTLGRSAGRGKKSVHHFVWNPETNDIPAKAFDGVTGIIHLAGAGVADERWTAARKSEILASRVKSTRLLFDYLKNHQHTVKTIVSASAVGYYGDAGDKLLTENTKPGTDFLASVCTQWEDEVKKFSNLGIREVRCRIGIVLSKNGGALPQLTKTLSVGAVSYFAKSPLIYSWIHVDDVCGIMLEALKNNAMHGAYNTTSPNPVSMKELAKQIVESSGKWAVVVPAPPLAIKLALGEMSDMLLSSQRCSTEKILKAGYQFKYPEMKQALRAIY